jgi:hypothetical protein
MGGMKVCHTRDQRSTTIRQTQRAKSTIGFKDDKMINDHDGINEGEPSRVWR